MLFLNECLMLLLMISLSTDSGNVWIHPRIPDYDKLIINTKYIMKILIIHFYLVSTIVNY